MSDKTTTSIPEQIEDETDDPQQRGRSSVEFPYIHLEDAETIARTVYSTGGTACATDKLAAALNTTVSSGTFRLRLSGARIFGLTVNERGSVTLTQLGQDLVHPEHERRARVEAFLMVPLYRQLYDRFKGRMLPGPSGLENEMVGLGVAPKQKERARQIFARSAEHAGFFEHGKDRLVEPTIARKFEEDKPPLGGGVAIPPKPPGGSQIDPLISGLLQKLPAADSDWSVRDRAKWLDALVKNLELVYKNTTGGTVEIKVQTKAEDEA